MHNDSKHCRHNVLLSLLLQAVNHSVLLHVSLLHHTTYLISSTLHRLQRRYRDVFSQMCLVRSIDLCGVLQELVPGFVFLDICVRSRIIILCKIEVHVGHLVLYQQELQYCKVFRLGSSSRASVCTAVDKIQHFSL